MTTPTSSKDILVDLLETFKSKGISHDPKRGLDKVLAFQDFLGQRASSDINWLYAELDQDQRKTFLWVTFSTLDHDSALEVLKHTAGATLYQKIHDKVENSFKDREENLLKREDEFATKRIEHYELHNEYQRKIAQLEHRITQSLEHTNYLASHLSKEQSRNRELQSELDKLQAVKELLKKYAAEA